MKPRLKSCVEAWPDAEEGLYNPLCCRFPKSCSSTVYSDGIDPSRLEEIVDISVAYPAIAQSQSRLLHGHQNYQPQVFLW